MHVLVHEANLQDYHGGKLLLSPLKERFPRLKLIWADSGYNKGGFVAWVEETLGWEVQIVEHPWSGLRGVWVKEGMEVDWEKIRPSGFYVLKWRWIVERSHSWINRSRRLLVGWEKKAENYLAFLHLACAQLIFAKLVVFG